MIVKLDNPFDLHGQALYNHRTMPFSSLNDPVDIARAQAALGTVWNEVRPGVPDADQERERTRLAYLVANFAHVALDEADLVRRTLDRYRKKAD